MEYQRFVPSAPTQTSSINLDNPPAPQISPPCRPSVFDVLKEKMYNPLDRTHARGSAIAAGLILGCFSPVWCVIPFVFSQEYSYYFGGIGAVLTAVQIVLALGVVCNLQSAWRLKLLRRILNWYFLVLFIAVLFYEGWSLYSSITYNWDHCADFVMYTVCQKRGGLMSTQLILAIFYPGVDLFIIVLMLYIRRCVKDLILSLENPQQEDNRLA